MASTILKFTIYEKNSRFGAKTTRNTYQVLIKSKCTSSNGCYSCWSWILKLKTWRQQYYLINFNDEMFWDQKQKCSEVFRKRNELKLRGKWTVFYLKVRDANYGRLYVQTKNLNRKQKECVIKGMCAKRSVKRPPFVVLSTIVTQQQVVRKHLQVLISAGFVSIWDNIARTASFHVQCRQAKSLHNRRSHLHVGIAVRVSVRAKRNDETKAVRSCFRYLPNLHVFVTVFHLIAGRTGGPRRGSPGVDPAAA